VGVASFANGVIKDQAAVSAAITSPWSNGQTEGQITKLKLVKPQMYGRGKIDLLRPASSGAITHLTPGEVRRAAQCRGRAWAGQGCLAEFRGGAS
jgi:hypothetical protein